MQEILLKNKKMVPITEKLVAFYDERDVPGLRYPHVIYKDATRDDTFYADGFNTLPFALNSANEDDAKEEYLNLLKRSLIRIYRISRQEYVNETIYDQDPVYIQAEIDMDYLDWFWKYESLRYDCEPVKGFGIFNRVYKITDKYDCDNPFYIAECPNYTPRCDWAR